MELVILPDTFVLGAVGPDSYALTLHFAVYKLALVHGVVGPRHHSISGDRVIFHISFIDFSGVCKIILTLAVEESIQKVALIAVVVKFEFAFSSFLALDELTLISCAIKVPSFDTMSVIFVVLDLSLVDSTLRINEDTETICSTVNPLSLDDISVRMGQPPLAIKLHILELALVYGSI